MTRVNSRRGLRILMPATAVVLFSFLMVLLAACGDSSATPVPASTTTAASITTAAATTAAATTAASPTTAAATTSASDTTTPATTPATTSGATSAATATPGASSSTGTAAKGNKNLDTAKGTIDSFDSSTGALAVKETNGQTTDFNASKATIVGVSKISLADFSKLSFTNKTVEFSAQPGSDGSFTPTALTILDQPAMANNAKGNATKTKKAGGNASATAAATPTPDASTTSGAVSTADANRVVLHNVSLSGNTLTGTSVSGTSATVNLSDTTTLNQRVSEKMSDLAAGDKLTVDYRPQGKKATGPANAVAIVIEK